MVVLNNNANVRQFGAGNNTVFARGGDDVIRGDGGRDRLFGQQGNDVLRGQADDDRLFGGADNDRLFGGPGEDRVRSGPGLDDVAYADVRHIAGDRLRDFDGTPSGDVIDLSRIDSTPGTPANNSFVFLGQVASPGAVGEGRVGLIDIGNDVRVVVNQNGGPRASLVVEGIEINANPAGDFLFSDDFML